MWQASKPFFEWNEASWIGQSIAASMYAFPVIETIHILALAIMLGSIVIIDLRLLGFGMKKQSVALIARNLEPYIATGLGIMLITGYLLFASEAMKCFENDAFKFKMAMLLPTIIFHFTLFRWVTHQDEARRPGPVGVVVGLLSLTLWFGVGAGGRAIGFI